MAVQSSVSEHLWLLDTLADFNQHSLQIIQESRRNITMLTRDLDAHLYGTTEFTQALSDFARSSRYSQIQILVKDTKIALESGHPIINLAQRLSSKISVRKMTIEPNNKVMGFLYADTDKLLYKNNEEIYRGFANYTARHEIKSLREEFNYLWQYGESDPEFQRLFI
jgi:hypothetical protein